MSVKELMGKRIREARQAKRLSEKIGMSAKYLSSVERGEENPTLDTLISWLSTDD